MKRTVPLVVLLLIAVYAQAQSFEVSGTVDTYKGYIGELIKAPVQIKNNSSKAITLVFRKADAQIGSTQKNFLCPDGQCITTYPDEFTLRLEPGQSSAQMVIGLEAGLVPGISRVKYVIFNRSNPVDMHEVELYFSVEERPVKNDIFNSRFITIHDVYPNPVSEFAFIDYKLHYEQVKAKIVIHNILGSALAEYPLPMQETKVKMRAEEFTPGVYFYTLYLDNEGVMTRKLIVKR